MTRFGFYERWASQPALGAPFVQPPGRSFAHFAGIMTGSAPVGLRVPQMWDGGAAEPTLPYVLAPGQSKPVGQRARTVLPIEAHSWVSHYDPSSVPAGAVQGTVRAIIAVIDDALPFANHAFDDGSGQTRVAYLWRQAGFATSSAAVPFGDEITGHDIEALRAATPTERALYQVTDAFAPEGPGMPSGLARGSSHGAHVMGIAAGNGSAFGTQMPDDIAIIGVQLPSAMSWDMTGYGKESHLLWAMHYIFDRAHAIAQHQCSGALPLVVNCSYGWPAGRPDGQGQLTAALGSLLARRQAAAPTELVLPLGNHFDAGLQARFELSDQTPDLACHWRVPPDDRSCSYLEIWFPQTTGPGDWTLELTAPDGATTALTLAQDPAHDGIDPGCSQNIMHGSDVIGQMAAEHHNGNRWRIAVALTPTRVVGGARQAPSGLWELRLIAHNGGLSAGDVIDVLVQRDDDPVRLRRGGRQSWLAPLGGALSRPIAPRLYPQTLQAISGFGAINVLARAPGIRAVGGLVDQRIPAPYSSAPPVVRTGQSGFATDHLSATSDRSPLRPGTLSIGVLSGSRSLMRGTSAAAPAVARAMVISLANGDPADFPFAPALPLPAQEHTNPLAQILHPVRVGGKVAPLIPPRSEVRRNQSGPAV